MYSHGGVTVEVDPQIPNGVGGKTPISTDPDWMVGNLTLPATCRTPEHLCLNSKGKRGRGERKRGKGKEERKGTCRTCHPPPFANSWICPWVIVAENIFILAAEPQRSVNLFNYAVQILLLSYLLTYVLTCLLIVLIWLSVVTNERWTKVKFLVWLLRWKK